MTAEPLSPRVLAELRKAVARNPQATHANTVRLLLDEIGRLKAASQVTITPITEVVADTQCPLPQRQLQILAGVANGRPTTVIARELGLTPKTVRKYRAAAMRRLDVRTSAQAAVVCTLRGWLPTTAVRLPPALPQLPVVRSREAFRESAELLRQHPGEWGTVAVYSTSASARQSAYRLRTGGLTAFVPAGAWEAEAYTEDGVHGLRARYIGTPTTAERAAS